MRSSQIISLFSERPEVSQRPSSFVASIVEHVGGISFLVFGIAYMPHVRDKDIGERFTVRHLDLHAPEPEPRRTAANGVQAPVHQPDKTPPGGSPSVLRQIAKADPGPQTLIQPDLLKHVTIKEETPVPTLVIWAPKVYTVKTLVAPLPAKPTAADVTPSVDRPNLEANLADVSIAASAMPLPMHAIPASTTSPVVVHGPQQVQMPPVTTSASNQQPTPTAVMSLSDLRMKEGIITLPPVNQSASVASKGALAQGPTADSQHTGNGNPNSNAAGVGAGQSAGDPKSANAQNGKPNGTKPGQGNVAGAGDDVVDQASTEQIRLPRDGQFGSVVVGATLEEQYPEAAKVWSGRVAYTVYLHVGLEKSWILQYSLQRVADTSHGGDAHLDAPWPFNIVRPNLPADTINADALMVHGFVNQQGRFEALAVAFPPEFKETQFVLDALRQWQFRPASQNGQAQRVEVLLIIPEEED